MACVMAVANIFLHLAEEQAKQEKGDLMTDLKLQKMLYFAQCWHVVRHEVPLFNSKIEAWDHGPVVPAVYTKYRQFGRDPIHAIPVDYSAFTKDELDTIIDVFSYYGRYSASGLREISHRNGSPWKEVYTPDVKHIEITIDSMKKYYKLQTPLETAAERVLRTAGERNLSIIEPEISEKGNPVLPGEDFEEWGNWDDD